jgi:hypothetical protein
MRNLDKKDGIVEPGSKLYDKVMSILVVSEREPQGQCLLHGDEKIDARPLPPLPVHHLLGHASSPNGAHDRCAK